MASCEFAALNREGESMSQLPASYVSRFEKRLFSQHVNDSKYLLLQPFITPSTLMMVCDEWAIETGCFAYPSKLALDLLDS